MLREESTLSVMQQRTLTLRFELTKRYTGEFTMRPLLSAYPERSFSVIDKWSVSGSPYVRRLASECMRISLPWAKRLTVAVEHFDEYSAILAKLKDDPDPYVRRSVENNLNDLSKCSRELFDDHVSSWMDDNPSENTLWIIHHGSRTIRKRQKERL